MESWAAFALLRAVRRFRADVAMIEVVNWRRSSKGVDPGSNHVAEGVPMFSC